MVDYAPTWDSLPRETLHASHDVPVQQIRKSATVLAELLDETKEEQVLKEACLGLCQLFGEGIQNDRIQAILEANVVPKLVSLLRPSRSRSVPISVQLAALQVLGNVACGDDQQTQVVIDSEALPCLRALLFSSDRQIRKEVCWIVSNITESSHQVQDVLDADILPPLLKLLENQDIACREDATWVLFNLSSNRVPNQIKYLAENDGIRVLCNLLTCQKELDVLWKGCGTVAAVALKGLRNILISGQIIAASITNGYNEMAALVAEAHGVERIEALTSHPSPDVGSRARLILERIFGAEPSSTEGPHFLPALCNTYMPSPRCPTTPSTVGHVRCSCDLSQNQSHDEAHYYQALGAHGSPTDHTISNNSSRTIPQVSQELHSRCIGNIHCETEIVHDHESNSGSSTDSDPDEDDSDSDLIPSPPAPCSCVLCTDLSPLTDRKSRGKMYPSDDLESKRKSAPTSGITARVICTFCSGGGRLGDGRAGLAAKLGRAVRLGHAHCLAVLLSRMTWSQRIAATEAPALLHPGSTSDGGVGSSLPAVILASQLGKPTCLNLLLRRCDPNLDLTYGKKRLTALAWSSHKGYLRCCRLLLVQGANPSTKCGDGITALHLAASCGHVAICRLLIDYMAPVNSKSSKKQTPLCLAAQKGYFKVVQILLDFGADTNNQDEGKYTPLHLAASNGFFQTVNILLNHGALVDAKTRNEVTALHYAVQGGHAKVVQALISAGAKVNCSKKPLLLIAADDGSLDIVKLLLHADASIDCRANIRAILDKETEICDYLTPLHLAASKNHFEVVELLIRQGANINDVTSKFGWAPLDFAVLNGHSESSKLLLQHGAYVSDTCKSIGRKNWTLVQYAARNGAKDVVRLLIQRIKEQNADMSASIRNGPVASMTSSPASKNCEARSFGGSLVSNSMATSYITSENIHTCKACSKLRQSSCASQQVRDGYAPRSLNGGCEDVEYVHSDESLANSSQRSGACSADKDAKQYLPSRDVSKGDRQSVLRAREFKKRETEAREARVRLEEAISQKSIAKLTEAISHVNKLVLNLAACAGGEAQSSVSEYGESSELSTHIGSNEHPGHSPASEKLHTANLSHSMGSTPLAMEVGLGNEVQKARKLLSSLLAEEKRVREEKEKEAMDSKRLSAEQGLKKSIALVLDGGDPRSLARAVNRAVRTILDDENIVVVEALNLATLISKLETHEMEMRSAIDAENLILVDKAFTAVKGEVESLVHMGGERAVTRLFRGKQPSKAIDDAEQALRTLQEKRKREETEQQEAMNQEREVDSELREAMKLDDAKRLENILKRAHEVLISKESSLASTIEAAKKVKARRLKTERRKLRQASSTNDPIKIEEAAFEAEECGLVALHDDVQSARAHAQKLRDQAAAAEDLQHAMSHSDIDSLSSLRKRLNSLGMFSEAESARSELERLLRAVRAGTLLEAAIQEFDAFHEHMKLLVDVKPADEVMEKMSTCSWPDFRRLRDLSNRARQHGTMHSSACHSADVLSRQLTIMCGKVMEACLESNDARAIAAVIAGVERTFLDVSINGFDSGTIHKSVEDAKHHLANVQAMDQASVKAEAAQVKVEYALATSRRSAARIRQNKGSSFPKVDGASHDQNSIGKFESCKFDSSELRDSRKPATNMSSGAEGPQSRTISTSVMENSHGDSFANSGNQPGGRSSKDECGSRERADSGSALEGECSHFYLFKEGNVVHCARCGNHRNSSNPEWLARVKRRGTRVPDDIDGERTQACRAFPGPQANLRKVYVGHRNTSLDFMEAIPERQQELGKGNRFDALVDVITHRNPSPPGFLNRSSGETSRDVVTTVADEINVMNQMYLPATTRPEETGTDHQLRRRGQAVAAPVNVMNHVQNMYLNNIRSIDTTLRAGYAGSSSVNQSIVPSLSTGIDSGSAHAYKMSESVLGMDETSPLCTNSRLSDGSTRGRRPVLMQSGISCRLETPQSCESNANLHKHRNSAYEDHVEASPDLCLDFENEDFGFDIDAIVEETAPVIN